MGVNNMSSGIYAKDDCGCGKVGPMYFNSEDSAIKAFSDIGLMNGGSLTDNKGETH